MRVKFILIILIALSFCAANVFAEEGHGHHDYKGSMMEDEHKGSMKEHMKEEASSAVEVGNKVCPVSGEKVGTRGPAVRHEYEGKIYNFCCAGCVETFKNDPEKYVKVVEEQMGQHKEMGSESGHEGHHHVMGEKDEQLAIETEMKKDHQSSEMISSQEAEVKEVNLEAYKFGYSPDTIVVNKGDLVKIYATSRDVPHGVFIKEYGINEKVEKGKVKNIEFVADKVGEFDIICSVYCGAGHHSMKAKLIVE